jgi:hypothetical protein
MVKQRRCVGEVANPVSLSFKERGCLIKDLGVYFLFGVTGGEG